MQRMRILVNLGVVVAIASGADAQSLGAFRWQLQPYCNVVTLSGTQVGGIYRVEGTDDRCGAAQASAVGTFLFADRSQGTVPYVATAANEFGVRASGGVYLYTNPNLTSGVTLAPNGSSWASLSDANAKENFSDVDGEDLLGKLAAMPVREWNYKAQDAAIRHMGPTAQDFRAAFGLGDFPLRINTIDSDGVTLAGVKALEARTRALADENAALRAALEDQRREWQAAIEALRNALAQK